jgi:glycosyltransferase involved in cell wall biosynthesis
MSDNHPSILLVGNFLSDNAGSRSAGEELNARLKQMGWVTMTTSSKSSRLLRLLDMMVHVLFHGKKYQIAYVEVYSGAAFRWAEIVVGLLYFLRKPCVLALHGGGLPEFAEKNMKRVSNLLSRAAQVVTPSNFILAAFQGMRSDIQYIPNGIDLRGYTFRERGQPAPRLIWIRAFHSIYQPLMAIAVLAHVRKVFPDAHLTMIGSDKKDGSLQLALLEARSAQVMDGLSITGPVPKSEIPGWLDKADIFLNTTAYESFGQAVLEAASSGLLIVSTNAGELPYLWENHSQAILVSSNDPNAMADAVIQVLNQPMLAVHLSHNARRKAEQFDWAVVMPQWEKLFMELYRSA